MAVHSTVLLGPGTSVPCHLVVFSCEAAGECVPSQASHFAEVLTVGKSTKSISSYVCIYLPLWEKALQGKKVYVRMQHDEVVDEESRLGSEFAAWGKIINFPVPTFPYL